MAKRKSKDSYDRAASKMLLGWSLAEHLELIQKSLILIAQDSNKKSKTFDFALAASCSVLAVAKLLHIKLPPRLRPRDE